MVAYGNFPVSLSDLEIAVLTAGSYGTPITIPSGMTLKIKPNLTSDKLAGFGKTSHVASFVIDANVTFSPGGYPFDVLAAILGATATESGTTPTAEYSGPVPAGELLAQFGVVGKAPAEDGGDTHFGLPIVTLTEMPEYTLDGEGNTFVKGEMKGLAIADSSGFVIYPLAHETAEAIDFDTIFA